MRVLLTDFDNAMIIGRAEKGKHKRTGTEPVTPNHCKHVICMVWRSVNSLGQGTPAFIAEAFAHLCLPPGRTIPFSRVQDLDTITAHPLTERHHSDMDFLQELAGYNRFNDENASHQAIHDAESIF